LSEKAIVVVSGGLDSTTLLYYVCNKKITEAAKSSVPLKYEPIVLTFDYGQKHGIEINHAKTTCQRLGLKWIRLGIPKLPGSALTENNMEVPKEDYSVETQKLTVVPNRNMVFLSIAASYAIAEGARKVFYAAHYNDQAVYPDCRPEFVDGMNVALKVANYEPVEIEAPFIKMTKADIVTLGWGLGVPFQNTWSCYDPVLDVGALGEEYPMNMWSSNLSYIHCGICGTCRERKIAFQTAGVKDPTRYAQ